MSWIRLDEDFADHPKVVQAGPLAGWLHVKAIGWCNRYLTDGLIPRSVARTLVSWEDVAPLQSAYHTDALTSEHVNLKLIERLLDAGMWLEVDGCYVIHDYLKFQPSRAKVMAEREAERAKKERWRNAKTDLGHVPAVSPHVSRGDNSNVPAVSRPGPGLSVSDPDPVSDPRKETDRKKQRPAKPERPPTEVYQVVEAWRTGWLERFKPADGRPPTANDADWKQAKNLLAAHGLEATLGYVTRFLDDTDKFVAERGHLLRDLPSRVERYRKGDGPLFKTGNTAPGTFTRGGDLKDEYT